LCSLYTLAAALKGWTPICLQQKHPLCRSEKNQINQKLRISCDGIKRKLLGSMISGGMTYFSIELFIPDDHGRQHRLSA
jgi:hypothetical protein